MSVTGRGVSLLITIIQISGFSLSLLYQLIGLPS